MIRIEGQVLYLEGDVTLRTVGADVEAGRTACTAGVTAVDCSGIAEADSAALALLLAWLRCARAAGRPFEFRGLPAGLKSLADLYGVDELLSGQA